MNSNQTVSLRRPTIPEETFDGLQSYIRDRQPPGFFLQAVLENNLVNAVKHADTENMWGLTALVNHIFYEAPSRCWGSAEKVRRWLYDIEN